MADTKTALDALGEVESKADSIPTTETGIKKLARDLATKKTKTEKSRNYKQGDPSDKVWDNYQIPKGLKREFKELCKAKNIVASAYLRACVRILIKKQGDLKKASLAVGKLDLTSLKED
jgi:hypothetical protein